MTRRRRSLPSSFHSFLPHLASLWTRVQQTGQEETREKEEEDAAKREGTEVAAEERRREGRKQGQFFFHFFLQISLLKKREKGDDAIRETFFSPCLLIFKCLFVK